ncbi:hypothetical protein ABT127_16875 [Streptomyces sp. NPDC001904]|uniref:hypothetical protein n=1 Tax=Streptomyces sp. NPDC001904 TaxID=3154531 RepID=UPI003328D8C9
MTEPSKNPDVEQRTDDSEFLDIARDPALARLLRKQLETLAKGNSGEILAEMASEVLAGRIGLREAVRVTAYDEALTSAAGKFQEGWDSMTELERSEAEKEGARVLRLQQEEIEQESLSRNASEMRPGGNARESRHSSKGWSLY